MSVVEKPVRTIIIICLIAGILIPGYFEVLRLIETHKIQNLIIIALNIFFTMLVTASISFANYKTIALLQKKFPWRKENIKRLVFEFIITNINAAIIISIIITLFYIFYPIFYMPKTKPGVVYFNNIVSAFIVNTIVCSIIEGINIFKLWHTTLIDTEQLKREKAESQYMALKNQVNPHFLFNSLNSLSSLIRTDKESALIFIDKFSKIYRYVLDSNDEIVVELKKEIDFIQSFIYLHQLRFGINLQIDIRIEESCLNKCILPLSLQILVENAIKHNEISSANPLRISIVSEKDWIIVSNNLQLRKLMAEDSTGIGIKNIIERYSHISDKKPVIGIENNNFVARLPLLEAN